MFVSGNYTRKEKKNVLQKVYDSKYPLREFFDYKSEKDTYNTHTKSLKI